MKIRTDFVTNSSSSSYIICYKNDIKELIEIVETIEEDTSSEIEYISSLEILDQYFSNKYSEYRSQPLWEILSENDYVGKLYDKYHKHLEDGYRIMIVEVEWYETDTIEKIKQLRNTKSLIIDVE